MKYDAIIIGAGFSGLYQLFYLREKLGLSAKIIEKGNGVGGTWYWNRYPGARCDSYSYSYCYLFSKEILDSWDWTEKYPQQPEIERYLNFVADKLKLKRDIVFKSKVNQIKFDEKNQTWETKTNDSKIFKSDFVITAVGCLSTANIPEIEGIKNFSGKTYHTGAWPKNGVDFKNKKVGIIGTGSTGIQAIPVIAKSAKKLTVFQRTANYSIPAQNFVLTEKFKNEIKQNWNLILKKMLNSRHGHPWFEENRSVKLTPKNIRNQIFEDSWIKGGLCFREGFNDVLFDEESNAIMSEFIKEKINTIVKNKKKAKILSDIDHPFGTKRPPIDTNYFETYNRSNVEIVNVKKDPIIKIVPKGIITKNNKLDLDIIVFATGLMP